MAGTRRVLPIRQSRRAGSRTARAWFWVAGCLVVVGFAIIAGGSLPGLAQDASKGPLRTLFGPPVQTLKQVIQGERTLGQPAPSAAPQAAPQAETPDDQPAVGAAAVPAPRPRPANRTAAAPPVQAPPDETPAPAVVSSKPPIEATALAPPEPAVTPAAPPAKAVAPVDPPRPAAVESASAPKPVVKDDDPPVAPAADPPAAEAAAVDVPNPRPRSTAKRPPTSAKLAALPPRDDVKLSNNCRRNLRALGITATTAAPIRKGSCGIAAPVEVSALDNGVVSLTTDATLACRTAQALGTWMRESVEPAAEQYLNGRVVGIRVAASYHCRTRNGVAGAKLSEHARGNAIDISAFKIDSVGWIEVGKVKGFGAKRFMQTIRKSACGPFTTVLGPGSDRYHNDHLHLDVAVRGKNGNSLYCK